MTLQAATRGSKLARTQSEHVATALTTAGHPTELKIVVSEGDTNTASLADIGGQGVFTAAVSAEVLKGQADFAIHSLKDLPTRIDPQLIVAASPRREDPRDVLVTRVDPQQLPARTIIGTGSLRRRVQLRSWQPTWEARDLRGNVDTRLGKVASGELDGVLLAAAGLRRLGLFKPTGLVVTLLDIKVMTPAVGQGALGLECKNNSEICDILNTINDPHTLDAVTVERKLLANLKGGCQVPFAAHVTGDTLHLVLADPDGDGSWRRVGPVSDAEKMFAELCTEGQSVIANFS